jgi:hypothetical protein
MGTDQGFLFNKRRRRRILALVIVCYIIQRECRLIVKAGVKDVITGALSSS